MIIFLPRQDSKGINQKLLPHANRTNPEVGIRTPPEYQGR